MATQVKITDLPSKTTIENSDYLVVDNGEQTSKTTKENLLKEVVQAVQDVASDVTELESTKQPNLVSGQNIKTVNGQSILGSGNIDLNLNAKANVSLNNIDSTGTTKIKDVIKEENYLKSTLFDALGLYVSNGYLCQKLKGE